MPIMWGLAIGAAMGGGIAALRGGKPEDILKGAAIGGATGALGGGISSLASAGAAGGVGAAGSAAANVAPSTALAEGITSSAITPAMSGVTVNGSALMGSQIPSAIGTMPLGAASLSAPAAGISPIAGQAATSAGTGFFGSGIGKTLADNKGILGAGALGLMALKPQGSSGGQEQESFIRPYSYNPKNQVYTAQAPIKSSDFGTRSIAEGGAIRMADGGEVPNTQEQRENRTNPTLEALAVMQQAQQSYQPPAPAVSQGITQPLVQPQMAQIQQHYAAPQRQAPDAFQYQTPSFVKYSNTGGRAGGGGNDITAVAQPVGTPSSPALEKAAGSGGSGSGGSGTYTGPGYYDRYPVADVYDYANNQPTRPDNPTSGSPEFNVRSNVPVDKSSGMAGTQQDYANMGYTDYIPNPHNVDGGGGANGGLMPEALRYAMGGGIGSYYPAPDDGNRNFDGISGLNQGPQYPMQGVAHSDGGVMNYAMGGQLGGYSDGGQLLKGPGNGTSDDIPAVIGNKQPARLADGEFVIPSRIVSELGNGSTDAGAKQLYAMMNRIQSARRKTVGKNKVAFDAKARNQLPA